MKKNLFICVLAILCASPFISKAQEPSVQNYIQVSTKADKYITPDEIYLSITIREEAGKSKASLSKIEGDMIKALNNLKIDVAKNLTVNDMESQIKERFLKRDDILASKAYFLKLNSAEQAANALKALNAIKIYDINLDRVEISEQLLSNVKNELISEAGKKAKEKADLLAKAVGSNAGDVIYIQYYESTPNRFNGRVLSQSFATKNAEMYDSDYQVNLDITKTNVSVDVLYRFSIKK